MGGLKSLTKKIQSRAPTIGGALLGGTTGATVGRIAEVDKKKAESANKQAEDQAAQQKSALDQKLAEMPKYQGLTGPDGKLQSQFHTSAPKSNVSALESKLAGVGRVTAGSQEINAGADFKNAQGDLGKLRERAFGTGPSAQAQAQMKQAEALNAQSRDKLAKDAARQQQSNVNAMAQQGGISAGSRERMANQAQKNKIMGMQGLARQNEQNNLSISAQDEAMRTQLQGQMPGMGMALDQYQTGLQAGNRNALQQQQQTNAGLDMQGVNAWAGMTDSEAGRNFQAERDNVQNAIGNNNNQNNWNMQGWNTGMQAYGANQAADAQLAATKQKGLLQQFGIG